jgi:hypothetical protein
MSLVPTSESPSGTGTMKGEPPVTMWLSGLVIDHAVPFQRSNVSAVQNDGTVARTRMITWFDRDPRSAVSSLFEKPRNPPIRVAPFVVPACAGCDWEPESPVTPPPKPSDTSPAALEGKRIVLEACGAGSTRRAPNAITTTVARVATTEPARSSEPPLIECQMMNRPHRPAVSQRITKIPNEGVSACAAATAMSVAEPARVKVRSRRAGTSKA